MGLQLIENRFDLPPLPIRRGEVAGINVGGVQDGGDQPEPAVGVVVTVGVECAVVDGVVDHPHPDRVRFAARPASTADLAEP